MGSDLELVSKDERELQDSRAELEALLQQHRSPQAATADSPPSTSSAAAPEQGPHKAQRAHRGAHTPKQATSLRMPGSHFREAAGNPALLSIGEGTEKAKGASLSSSSSSSKVAAQPVGLSTSNGSPFASISGSARPPSNGNTNGNRAMQTSTQASSVASQDRQGEQGQQTNEQGSFGGVAATRRSLPNMNWNEPSDTSSLTNSHTFALDEPQHSSPSLDSLQNGDTRAAANKENPSAPAAEQVDSSVADLQPSDGASPQMDGSPNGQPDAVVLQESHAIRAEDAPIAVRWLRPKVSPAQPLQVRKSGPTRDLIRRYSGPPATAAEQHHADTVQQQEFEPHGANMPDAAIAEQLSPADPPDVASSSLEGESSHADMHTDLAGEDGGDTGGSEGAVSAAVSADDAGHEFTETFFDSPPHDARPSANDSSNDVRKHSGIFADVDPAGSHNGEEEVPDSHATLDRLVRARQEHRAGQLLPRWTAQSWESRCIFLIDPDNRYTLLPSRCKNTGKQHCLAQPGSVCS